MKRLFLYFIMFLACNSALAAHKYEGRLQKSECGIITFHIFRDCNFGETKPYASPYFYCHSIRGELQWINADGSKDSIKIDSLEGYFSLPSSAEPREICISCDGYKSRTVRIDLVNNDFFYSCVLLKDFSSLKNECESGYSLFWMNMLAQAYKDGYLIEKDIAKADSITKFAAKLYSPDAFNRIGVVLDGDTGQPIENVKFSYLRVSGDWKESIISSDKNGVFNIDLPSEGSAAIDYYGIKINAAGYQERTVLFGEPGWAPKLPMPYITTLIKDKNNMKKKIKGGEMPRFWEWQLGQCFLDGYSVKRNVKKAKELFWQIDWTAGTTYYLDNPKYALDTDWAADMSYFRYGAERMSFHALGNRKFDYSDFHNDAYFWAGILGDFTTFAQWEAPDNTIASCHAKIIAERGSLVQRLLYSRILYKWRSPYAFDCLSNVIDYALKVDRSWMEDDLLTDCMNDLAQCYRFGYYGAIADEVKADYWTTQAALRYNEDAKIINDYYEGDQNN